MSDAIDPATIPEHRAAGWPDFHPEHYCHECGHRNPSWWALEWPSILGTHAGILCPRCFMLKAPDVYWVVARWEHDKRRSDEAFVAFLESVSGLDADESARVARCVLDYFQAGSGGMKP